MTELSVTVGELVSFCHRSGDIDHRFTPSPTGVQGIAGHQQVYRRRPSSYRSEFAVEYRHCRDEVELVLRGRADGYDPDNALVEEIKTCRVNPASIPPAVSRMHLAQARLYAAIIAQQQQLERLEVRLTWFNLDSGRESPLSQTYTREELQAFLDSSLAAFADWQDRLAAQRRRRDESLRRLPFPHGTFRSGQREIAELVYKCVDRAGELLVEAQTGIGPLAVSLPALGALLVVLLEHRPFPVVLAPQVVGGCHLFIELDILFVHSVHEQVLLVADTFHPGHHRVAFRRQSRDAVKPGGILLEIATKGLLRQAGRVAHQCHLANALYLAFRQFTPQVQQVIGDASVKVGIGVLQRPHRVVAVAGFVQVGAVQPQASAGIGDMQLQRQVAAVRMEYAPGDQQLRAVLFIGQHPHHAPGIGVLQGIAQQHRNVLRLGFADLGKNALPAVGGLIGGNTRVEDDQADIQQPPLLRRVLHHQRDIAHRGRRRFRVQAGELRLLGPRRGQQDQQCGRQQAAR